MTRINSDNLFGLSSFIVDATASQGSFTTIQSAINAASAGDVIYVKGGTYTETLTLKPGVDLIGVASDGRIPGAAVQVIGNHIFNTNGIAVIEGIAFSGAAGSVFTITGGPGVTPFLALKYSLIDSSAGTAATFTGGSGMLLFASVANSQLATFILTNAQIQMEQSSSCSSNTAECFLLNASSMAHIEVSDATGATSCFNINDVTAAALITNSTIYAQTSGCVLFSAAGTVESFNNIMRGNDVSGFYVEGVGNYRYAGDVPTDSAKQIDPATSQFPFTWRPFATTGTTGTAVRGTAGFDTTDFTIVDGFVQLIGGPTGITWIEQPISAPVAAFTGSFASAGMPMTLTLPALPADGDTCEFLLDGIGPLTVQADVADKIRIGAAISAAGGTATTSAQGDALTLTFRLAASTWLANNLVGIWTVV